MNVIYCDESHASAWDEYVSSHEQGSFYHLFGWKRVNELCFGHQALYLAAMDEGQIRGVFPLIYLKGSFFGRILCSLPFVNYGGPCVDDSATERLLLEEVRRLVGMHAVDYLEIRSTRKLDGDFQTSEHKISITVSLDTNPDVIWDAFKTGHRKHIRQAYKRNLSVRIGGGELLDTFYAILEESWKHLGTPLYEKQYFETVLKTFPEQTRIFVVDCEGVPIAAALNGYFGKLVEGMWLGTRPTYRPLEPSYVLYWEMIRDSCMRGFQQFHLGRSTVDSGGETFKRKWNAYPTQLYWQYVLPSGKSMPQLNVGNPKYQIAMRLWRVLPSAITRAAGPWLAKGIP